MNTEVKDLKVVFLDVDGVLNSPRNVLAFGGLPFPNCNTPNDKHFVGNLDWLAVGMLRTVCEEMGAVVVLHSTWRKHMSVEDFSLLTGLPVLDRTDPAFEPKSDAIACWLRDNPQFNVTHFAVVEDENVFHSFHRSRFRRSDTMLSDEQMSVHLVLTDRVDGFLMQHALEVARLLGHDGVFRMSEKGSLNWAFGFDKNEFHHA